MGAAVNAAHRIVQALAKTPHEVCANELPIRGADLIARAWIRHSIGARLDRANGVLPIDRNAHVHRVNRLTGSSVARQQKKIVILDVGEMRIDVEQTIVAFETFVRDTPFVKALAGNGRRG